MTSLMTSSLSIIIDTKRATSQTSLPVSFTEVLVSFNRCALLWYLQGLILASERTMSPTGLSSFNSTQHVNFPTQNKNHILDFIITSCDSIVAPSFSITNCSLSDHSPIFTKPSIHCIPLGTSSDLYHCIHSIINIKSFTTDILSFRFITNPAKLLGSLLIAYNATFSFSFGKHIHSLPTWFTCMLPDFRSTVQHAKNKVSIVTTVVNVREELFSNGRKLCICGIWYLSICTWVWNCIPGMYVSFSQKTRV